jgi:hypothetical protein
MSSSSKRSRSAWGKYERRLSLPMGCASTSTTMAPVR